MKLQSLFPHNPTNDGLKEIYRQVGSDSFYFNAEGVRSNDKIITTGKTFLLLTVSTDRTIKEIFVNLRDVFSYKDYVYLLLLDMETQKVFLINQFLDADDGHCNWRLLGFDYLKQRAKES
jgi:hypothetical protein